MSHPNASTALARVVIDELVLRGVRMMVISPGSRSAALAIAASQHPEIETRVVIDERSAAFHALGVARASGYPTAVLCTSGTAAANFFPAIVEADMSCVPLVAITADRPAELQGVGANQTIDQVGMFGTRTRANVVVEAPDPGLDGNRAWRATVADMISRAVSGRPGPVHLNVRFREPTVPVTDDGRTRGAEYRFETPRVPDIGETPEGETTGEPPVLAAERGLVIAGDGAYDRDALVARAVELGWPIVATALSGMRGRHVVATYHHLLAEGVPIEIRPETVVAVGSIGPSTRLESLFGAGAVRVRVDRWGRSIDPRRDATQFHHGDVTEVLGRVDGAADPEWSTTWLEADLKKRHRIDSVLAADEAMSGAAVASALNEIDWEALVVGSSLPIREVDAHLRHDGPVYANRGASGIDGFVSTALGVASRRPRTLAVCGDLSLLHDANGFLHDDQIDLTIIVIDNHGGGVFDSLPQANHAPEYERLFVTDPHRSLGRLARFHELRYAEADATTALIQLAGEALALPGVDLIRVEVDRAHDLEMRAQLDR